MITVDYRIVATVCIQIHPSLFLDRIPAEPASEAGPVPAVAVVVQFVVVVLSLGREAVRELAVVRAGVRDEMPEGVVGVRGDLCPALVHVRPGAFRRDRVPRRSRGPCSSYSEASSEIDGSSFKFGSLDI